MPVITVEVNWPQELEDKLDLFLARARRMKRRLKINWYRRLAIIRNGCRELAERLKAEDKRPILKSGES